ELEWRKTIHHIPTSALRVRCGTKRVGYSADTSFDPGLIDWPPRSDLFFHQANPRIHTPLGKLAPLPRPPTARLKALHYPHEHHPAHSPIPCALEGERIDI